jgi:hypothetical protein
MAETIFIGTVVCACFMSAGVTLIQKNIPAVFTNLGLAIWGIVVLCL